MNPNILDKGKDLSKLSQLWWACEKNQPNAPQLYLDNETNFKEFDFNHNSNRQQHNMFKCGVDLTLQVVRSINLGTINIPCNFFIKETTELSELSLV